MLKEIIKAGEKLTGYKYKTYEPMRESMFGFHYLEDLESDKIFKIHDDCGIQLMSKGQNGRFAVGRPLPQKGHKGIYEIARGNIFWEDRSRNELFCKYIDLKELDLLEELEIESNVPDDYIIDNHSLRTIEVLKGILKYKFGGNDV